MRTSLTEPLRGDLVDVFGHEAQLPGFFVSSPDGRTGTHAATNNTFSATRVVLSRDFTVDRARFKTTSQSGNFQIGVYLGADLSRVYATTADTLPDGLTTYNLGSNWELKKGVLYLMGMAFDGSAGSMLSTNLDADTAAFFGTAGIEHVTQAEYSSSYPLPDNLTEGNGAAEQRVPCLAFLEPA